MRTVQLPLKPCQLYDRVRQLITLDVTDRTIRRWRSEAFVERKRFYTDADARQIAEYAVVLLQLGDVIEARKQFAQILDTRKQSKNVEISPLIDVPVEFIA